MMGIALADMNQAGGAFAVKGAAWRIEHSIESFSEALRKSLDKKAECNIVCNII
jgi:hypothetical protein